MKRKMSKLSKIASMYSGRKEIEEQFMFDVKTTGKEFEKVVEHYNQRDPWDQLLLVTVLTDILACLVVNAKFDGIVLENAIEESFRERKEKYMKQAKELLLKK